MRNFYPFAVSYSICLHMLLDQIQINYCAILTTDLVTNKVGLFITPEDRAPQAQSPICGVRF